MKRTISIFLGLMLCLGIRAMVYTPISVPNPKVQNNSDYVCNPDGLIPPEDCDYLNALAARLEDSTMVELCVVALDDIGDSDAFDFCYELFQRWGIGKKGKDTGVLLFVARQSRDVRIMTGGGIEGVLTDAVCNRIVQQDMIPLLRQEDWGGALCLGSLRMYEQCTHGSAPEELRNAQSITNRGAYAEEDDTFDWWAVVIIISVIALMVVLALYFERKRCPKCHRRAMVQTDKKVLTRATLLASGIGIMTYTCKHCGHKMTKTYTIEKELPVIIGSGGHGGGFGGGGFHGGSFGGGGTFGGGAGGKF